jgi:DNA-directed RNA polymerase specialized sigma24 family protein
MKLDTLGRLQDALLEVRDEIAEEKERHKEELSNLYDQMNQILDARQQGVSKAMEAYTATEIADAMDIDVQNVYSLMRSRARKRYR